MKKTQKNNWKKELKESFITLGNISNKIWQNIDDHLIEHPKTRRSYIIKSTSYRVIR